MARQAEQAQKWWLTLMVAVLPALIAGWFSLRAIDKANASAAQADKTSSELTVAYDLMKQALELVQHEADADREALQKNNDLLVKLLEQKRSHDPAELAMLAACADGIYLVEPHRENESIARNAAPMIARMGGRLRGMIHTQF